MKLNLIKAYSLIVLGIITVGVYIGCKPEDLGAGNGLVANNQASFTITTVSANHYIFRAVETGVLSIKWDLGDGNGASPGTAIDTVFIPDAGTYNVVLTTTGIGGAAKTATQTLTVPLSDPKSGNLVLGGKMLPGDDAHWTHFTIGGSNFTFDSVKHVMVANENNYNQGAIYQAFNLVAGQKYMVDMFVSGSGATNTWFEVWIGNTQPVNGTDYAVGQKPISLNTWAGCGATPFSGKLSGISCATSLANNANDDPFTVPTTGTYYLVIKCGGQDTGLTGISFTNVTLRGVN